MRPFVSSQSYKRWKGTLHQLQLPCMHMWLLTSRYTIPSAYLRPTYRRQLKAG
jgi:hypothetical protein